MAWFAQYPLSSTSMCLIALIMIGTLVLRLHRARRAQRLRHQPIALDLATSPAQVRQNLRRA